MIILLHQCFPTLLLLFLLKLMMKLVLLGSSTSELRRMLKFSCIDALINAPTARYICLRRSVWRRAWNTVMFLLQIFEYLLSLYVGVCVILLTPLTRRILFREAATVHSGALFFVSAHVWIEPIQHSTLTKLIQLTALIGLSLSLLSLLQAVLLMLGLVHGFRN